MSIYRIRTQAGDILSLDSTSSIRDDLTGKLTSFPLEDGESAADHYINENEVITLTGIISDFKSVKGEFIQDAKAGSVQAALSTENFIRDIKALKESKKTFSVFISDTLNPITNCLFTRLSFVQDKTNGSVSEDVKSYKVTMTLKQVRFGTRARAVVIRDEDVKDTFADSTTTGKGTTDVGEKKESQILAKGREIIEISKRLLEQ